MKKSHWRKVVNPIGSVLKSIADSSGGFNLKRCTGSSVFYCGGLHAELFPADGCGTMALTGLLVLELSLYAGCFCCGIVTAASLTIVQVTLIRKTAN